MPTIEILDDDEGDIETNEQSLEELISAFGSAMKIPKAFQNSDWSIQRDAAALLAWQNATSTSMNKIRVAVQTSDELAIKEAYTSLIEIVAPFIGSGAWITSETKRSAEEILSILGPPSQTQIRDVLLQVVKPAFENAAQNEQLNSTTASKINRSMNPEPMYHADEDDIWKQNLGLVNIILWCLGSLQDSDWEMLWPLLIPPVLTYMDDWEAIYRLYGVSLCRRLVKEAPSSTLTRTGIDQLMRTSLETSLLRYSDPVSPSLFKDAMMASLELVKKTTKPGSRERYQLLFSLLGESIIGGAWMYGYREVLLIQATYEVLPILLDAMGITCVRYLKALVPQLLHTLVPAPEIIASSHMQEANLRALHKVIQIGAPRMSYWSGEIVSGTAKYWISWDIQQPGVMQDLLVDVLRELKKACPEIFQEHVQLLRGADEKRFASFIQLAE